MAWIELHQGLGTHVKTRRLCKLLGIGPAQAVGHLALLWTWALDAAENGSLAKYQADDLALVCEWDGDAAAFVAALEKAGFLDSVDGELVIHDWQDYIGKLVEHRERYRLLASERKRKQRERVSELKGEAVTQESRDGHAPVTQLSRESHADVTRDTTVSHAHVTPGHALTQPNLTKHVSNHVCADDGTPDLASSKQADAKGFSYSQEFDAFWAAYPRKAAKRDAYTAWLVLRKRFGAEQILAALDSYKRGDQWTKDDGKFIPHPATWLRRVDPDEVTETQADVIPSDVPDKLRGKPWLFHYLQAKATTPQMRITVMAGKWGFTLDQINALVDSLGSYSAAADEMWRRQQEKEAGNATANG